MHAANLARAPYRGDAQRYTSVAIALHWLLALLIVAQLALGWWMLGVPKHPPGVRAGWFNLHKSIGLTLALLVLLRIGWRLAHRPPSLPAALPPWQRLAAGATHSALYACMLLLPLTGFLGSIFTKYPIRYFGIALPHWGHDWPAAKAVTSTLHESLVWILMLLLAMHLLAAMWHGLRRDGIFSRMFPFTGDHR
jgi:cytochrome b561